jgi:hypothetical protein
MPRSTAAAARESQNNKSVNQPFTEVSSKERPMQTKKCPVCGTEIKDGGVKAKAADGQEVTVCCEGCAKQVQEHPADYATAAR